MKVHDSKDKKDIFVNLSNGFGKSVIFQALPERKKYLV